MGDPHYETLGHRYCGNCGFHLNTYFWAFTCTPDSPCRCCLQAAIERVREHCSDILKDYSADALTLTVGEVLDLLDGTR